VLMSYKQHCVRFGGTSSRISELLLIQQSVGNHN
jgi:hypothetical protein